MTSEIPDEGKIYFERYTFKVQKSFKGIASEKAITVDTGMGFGDCGFLFNLGPSYLVYGSTQNNILSTGICTRNKMVGLYPDHIFEEVKSEILQLHSLTKKGN